MPPKSPPHTLTRRQALKAGAGLGFGALAAGGCGLGPNRCVDGPVEPDDTAASGVAPTARQLLRTVDHVVVLMMENRSFDNFLGALRTDRDYRAAASVDGLTGTESNPGPTGSPVVVSPMVGNGTLDPEHSWDASRLAFNGGRNDGFVRVNAGIDQGDAMGYLTRDRLPYLYQLADQSVVCDRWFSSVMGPTWPNRFYLHAATADGRTRNHPMGFGGPATIWERLAERCWTAKNYFAGPVPWYSVAFPAKSFSGDDAMVPEPIEGFFRDARNGDLPNFSVVDPDFQLNDGHPPHDLSLTEAFISSVHRALASGPRWSRTLLVITFDEHGGFYDHVAPPQAADPLPAFRQLGFRVPAIVTGPMVRRGAVISTTYEHVSVLSTLRTRFGIASLGQRMSAAADLADCIDPAMAAAADASGVVSVAPAALPAAVDVSLSRALTAPVHATSQPEMVALARAGGVPAAHVDARPIEQRLRSWLRMAQELEAVRVVR